MTGELASCGNCAHWSGHGHPDNAPLFAPQTGADEAECRRWYGSTRMVRRNTPACLDWQKRVQWL